MEQSRKYHGLDALRGAAAIGVLLFHSSQSLKTLWLAPSGYLAVDLFFVMSGFVIANAYERRLRDMGVARFMRVRIIRFLPLFYLGGLLGLGRAVLLTLTDTSDVTPAGALAYFFFLPAPPAAQGCPSSEHLAQSAA